MGMIDVCIVVGLAVAAVVAGRGPGTRGGQPAPGKRAANGSFGSCAALAVNGIG
jgi:hypothetical protein